MAVSLLARRLGNAAFRALAIAAFVFAFLFAFGPFGLSETAHIPRLRIAGAFAGATFVTLCLVGGGLAYRFRRDLGSRSFTQQSLMSALQVSAVALANILLAYRLGLAPLTVSSGLRFLGYTALVGVFPVVTLELLRRNAMAWRDGDGAKVVIASPEVEESLSVDVHALLYIESRENYVILAFDAGDQGLEERRLRAPLRYVEERLSPFGIAKVHRSYLANLDNATAITGGARDCRIHFGEKTVPVSRTYYPIVRRSQNRGAAPPAPRTPPAN
jgi:hypothetical protein